MRVLICGGGVIGASIAYFLSRRGAKATVIERTGVACAASGKSGGFLALDWCDGTSARGSGAAELCAPCEPRGQRSAGDWGYRRLTTYGGSAAAANRAARVGRGAQPSIGCRMGCAWIAGWARPTRRRRFTPAQFTAALMQAAQANGARAALRTRHRHRA